MPQIEAVGPGSNEGNSERSPSQVPCLRAALGKPSQGCPVPHGDEVPWLRILRALGPPASIED